MAKRPCEAAHPDPRATESECKNCWRAVHVRAYQIVWGLEPTGEHAHSPGKVAAVKVEPVRVPLCVHRGSPVPPPDRKPSTKLWVACEHPNQPLGSPVCSCKGCGPSCAGYQPDAADSSPETVEHPGSVRSVRDRFVAEFRAEVERCQSLAYPEGRFTGRGVVIPAGGWSMLPGVYVTARMLRWDMIRSELPIEVWYVGDEGEFDPLFAHITASLGVTWRDVSEELRRLGVSRRERLHGWAVKPLALLLSSFEEVLMVDSDCYPVYAPEKLWAHPAIADKPAAFWQDNPRHKNGRPLTIDQWDAFGMSNPLSAIPGFESGQMLVDKRRSWAAVNVAAFLADRMDYFDATRADHGKVGIHGDKELFSVAWRAAGVAYHMAPPVTYREVAFLQPDPDGGTAFVHRCNDKPKIDRAAFKYTNQRTDGSRYNFRSTTLPHEHAVHKFLDDLRDTLRPNLPGFRDGTQDEQVWREVRVENVYRLPPRMDGWKVVDVGAHIGLFSDQCLRRGAALAIAVEPYFPNAVLARQNLAPWVRKCSLVEAAVAEPGVAEVQMRGGHSEQNTGEPFVAALKGIEGTVSVPTVTLDELIERCGVVDLLKLDCEGSEYPALLTAKRLADVRRVAGEYHTYGLSYKPAQIRWSLEAAGFTVEMVEGTGTGMFFAWRDRW